MIMSVLLFSTNAYAYKECTVQISRLYAGDNGSFWMLFKNGGSTYITQDNVNFKNIYSMVLAAHLAGKTLTVRFEADGTLCNQGTRTDLVGVWLEGN